MNRSLKFFSEIKQSFLVLLCAVAVLAALGGVIEATGGAKVAQTADAQTSDQYLAGWAWSDGIGWISFSCANTNTCDSVRSYAVKMDSTGKFSGYAWSDNIGWISFNETAGCPEPYCDTTPALQSNTGDIIGWARALSFGGGWDGWIKLGGSWPTSAALFQDGNIRGYSWGSDVVGWIKWDWYTGSPVCPDGSPVPPSGICKDGNGGSICPDGSPVPPSGVCSTGGGGDDGTGGGPSPCESGGVCICQTDIHDECRVIIAENQSPVAVIGSPVDGVEYNVNSVIPFDGSGSYDPDGAIVANGYEWRDNDCTSGLLLGSSDQFTTKLPLGIHTIFLRVKDARDAWSTNCPSVRIGVGVPLPINGVCGPASKNSAVLTKPTTGLCSVGSPSAVTEQKNGSLTSWIWTCSGDPATGGVSASCGAYGSCGNNICEQAKGENPASCRQDCPLNVREF